MDKYCILPGGNSPEFHELDLELIRRGIKAKYCESRTETRIYCIPECDLEKLPFDKSGPYLGNDNSGHSIYDLPLVEELRSQWGCSEWKSLM
jgi:hypothetical protein